MDSGRFEKYIEDYGRDIYSFCMYMTGARDDADDLYQQTFLVAFEKDEIEEGRNPKSYLISIAANIWKNTKRKRLWRAKSANVVYLEDEEFEQLSDNSQSVEDKVIRSDEEKKLLKLVDGLPEKMRVVIVMYYMEEMSVDDIAAALGIPAGTVKSRMNKARNILKEKMDYGK
jgi:RNA polymerase sigma factor, sigma-70 family